MPAPIAYRVPRRILRRRGSPCVRTLAAAGAACLALSAMQAAALDPRETEISNRVDTFIGHADAPLEELVIINGGTVNRAGVRGGSPAADDVVGNRISLESCCR